jgi:N-acetylglucosaminyldiphosphoundecaprenol N-acetyl-beta-D-mannosaminyltransferase
MQGKMNNNKAIPFITIMDARIDNLTMDEVLEQIEKLVARSIPSHVITANVDHLMRLHKSLDSRDIFRKAALIVPDGVPLLWAARFLRTPLQERINGTDLMEKTCELAVKRGFSVFLLGGPEGVAAGAARNLQIQFPGLIVSGTYSPYHGFENDAQENERICCLLREKKPDILFTSLGLPKGINWIDRHLPACGIALAIEVGASFMFISGCMKRAPRWMQKNGLEWLWRLILEPRRLWRRYLLNDLPFFYYLLRNKFPGSKTGKS